MAEPNLEKDNILKTNGIFTIRAEMLQVLDILLLDRTTSPPSKLKNIIWADDNYIEHGEELYAPIAQILPELITGKQNALIIPRALKRSSLQRGRTRGNAEVFTPTWVVKNKTIQLITIMRMMT